MSMKKIISLITIVSILFSMTCATTFATENKGAERFKDLKTSDWHFLYVDKLTKLGAIAGMPNGTFAPNQSITRAEFVTIVVGTTIGKEAAGSTHWAGNYIKKAEGVGLLFPDEFKPNTWDTPIRRGEMAKIVSRCMDYVLKEEIIKETQGFTKNISDWNSICNTCKPDIAQAYGKGIIAGMPDKSFDGEKTATRAEATTMIVRLIDKTYRYTLIGNVPFTPVVDVAADGRMKQAKAKEYMDQTLNSLEFYRENRKFYVRGTFPELPEGFENWLDVLIVRKGKPLIAYTNGFTTVKKQVITKTGSFTQELVGMTSTAEVEMIELLVGITAPKAPVKEENFEGFYSITTNEPNTIALVSNKTSSTQYLKYDVLKLIKW